MQEANNLFQVSADACYSYDGEKVHYVDEDTVMHVCGNGLKFVSARTGQQSFLWASNITGISAVATHAKTKRFAYATRMNNPDILIFGYPTKMLQCSLGDGTDLEYADIAFSRDGQLMTGIGKLTDFKFVVWDIESEQKLKGGEAVLPVPCSFVSFNPVNSYQLCTGGEKGIYFWRLNRSYDTFQLVPRRGIVKHDDDMGEEEGGGGGEEEEEEDGPRNQFIAHCWSSDGWVYASNMAGELLKFATDTGEVRDSVSVGGGVLTNALLLMREHLMVGGVDGVLRWLSLPEHLVQQSATVATRRGGDREALSIRHLAPNPYYDRIVVGTAQGSLHELILEAEEDRLGIPGGPGGPGGMQQQQATALPTKISELGDFHCGVSHAAVPVPELGDVMATVGEDGYLRVWDFGSKALLCKLSFGATPLCVAACSPHAPLLAIGSADGVLRVALLSRVGDDGGGGGGGGGGGAMATVIHRSRLHTGPLTHLAFHRHLPFLATYSPHDRKVFMLDTRPRGLLCFRAFAFLQVPAPPADYLPPRWGTPVDDPEASAAATAKAQQEAAAAVVAAAEKSRKGMRRNKKAAAAAAAADAAAAAAAAAAVEPITIVSYKPPTGARRAVRCMAAVAWHSHARQNGELVTELLIATGDGSVFTVPAPNLPEDSGAWAGREDADESMLWLAPLADMTSVLHLKAKLDTPATSMLVLPPTPKRPYPFLLVASAIQKSLCLYQLPPVGAPPHDAGRDGDLQPLVSVPAHQMGSLSMTRGPRGTLLATGGADGSVMLWRLPAPGTSSSQEAPVPLQTLTTHALGVTTLAFSADQSSLFSQALDGSVFHWRLQDAAALSALAADDSLSFALGVVDRPVVLGAGAEDVNVLGYEQLTNNPQVMKAATEPERPGGGGGGGGAGREDGEGMGGGGNGSGSGEMTVLQRIADARRIAEERQHQETRNRRRGQISGLRARLHKLLQHNDMVSDLERMDRDEFVVDLQAQAELKAEVAARAEAVRDTIRRQNLQWELATLTLKKECWDSMETPGCHLLAMDVSLVDGSPSPEGVSNFPIVRLSEQEKQRQAQVMLQRRCELREVKLLGGGKVWPSTLSEIPAATVEWLVNEGLLKPITEVLPPVDPKEAEKKKAAAERKGGDGDGSDEEEDEAEASDDGGGSGSEDGGEAQETLLDLLYPPQALRTAHQKRRQIVLLQALIREIECNFNLRFGELRALKEDMVERVRGKNERLSEILGELGVSDPYYVPVMADIEVPERVTTVRDEEVTAERYLSEAERERLRLAAEEKARLDAERAKDNLEERALADMMHGTLESKTEMDTLAQELVREEWMDELTYEEMTEAQRKALEVFEGKQKAVMEEKEKMRKSLELEGKKLRTEVAEVCRTFTQRLREVRQLKIRTQLVVFTQEQALVRLALSLLEKEDELQQLKRLDRQLRELREKRGGTESKVAEFSQQVERYRSVLAAAVEEDKQLDRSFKSRLQEVAGGVLAPDSVRVLYGLYKLRRGKRRTSFAAAAGGAGGAGAAGGAGDGTGGGSGGGGGGGGGGLGGMGDMKSAMRSVLADAVAGNPNDPYSESETALFRLKDPVDGEEGMGEEESAPLNMDTDCPEGFLVEDHVWVRLQDLRQEKLESEHLLRCHNGLLAVMSRHLARLTSADSALVGSIEALEAERGELLANQGFNTRNIELMARLLQGQDEVEQEAVVTDYTDAALINRSVVEEKNEQIVKLGREKVGILTKIKNFRRSINFMVWQHRHLEYQAHDLEEHYTDLHMLRVTKELQAFIKGGGSGDRQKEGVAKVEKKLEHMKRSHAAKMAKLKRQMAKINKQIAQKSQENQRLSAHCEELEANVSVRESIQRARAANVVADDPTAVAQSRMRAIVTRRKLIDLARAQTDEIEFLRQELDRLRQRTFPSFAHSGRQLHGNVDELF